MTKSCGGWIFGFIANGAEIMMSYVWNIPTSFDSGVDHVLKE